MVYKVTIPKEKLVFCSFNSNGFPNGYNMVMSDAEVNKWLLRALNTTHYNLDLDLEHSIYSILAFMVISQP